MDLVARIRLRMTQVGSSSLLGDYVTAVLRHLASAAAGIGTVALVARALGAEGVALWSLLGTASFLLGLSDLGLGTAAQRAIARGDDRRCGERLGLSLVAIAIVGTAAAFGVAAWLIGLETAAAVRRDLLLALGFGLTAGLIGAVAGPYRLLAVVVGELGALARARAAGAAVQLALTIALLGARPTLVSPAVALLVGSLVELLLLGRAVHRRRPALRVRVPLERGRTALREALSDGAGALAIHGAVALAVRADLALVVWVAPLSLVAAYSVASRAVDQVFTLAKQASAASLPRLSDPARRAGAVVEGTQLLGTLAAAGLAALVTLGEPLLRLWATPAVWQGPAQLILVGLGCSLMVGALAEVPAAALTLTGRSSWTGAVPVVVGNLVRVVVGAAGAWSFGLSGLILGSAVGHVVLNVLVWRRLAEVAPGVRLRQCLGRPAVAAIVAGGLGALVGRLGPESMVATLALCGLTAAAGVASSWMMVRIPRSAYAAA